MKTLIEKIEGLKRKRVDTLEDNEYNEGIDTVLNLLQSHPVIHCKALRKRGTDRFYYYNPEMDEYCPDKIPFPFTGNIDELKDADPYFPEDAELINLTIIVEGDEK